MTQEPPTIEINAKLAHRAWGFLDLATNTNTIETYAADDLARDHLRAQLVQSGYVTRKKDE